MSLEVAPPATKSEEENSYTVSFDSPDDKDNSERLAVAPPISAVVLSPRTKTSSGSQPSSESLVKSIHQTETPRKIERFSWDKLKQSLAGIRKFYLKVSLSHPDITLKNIGTLVGIDDFLVCTYRVEKILVCEKNSEVKNKRNFEESQKRRKWPLVCYWCNNIFI